MREVDPELEKKGVNLKNKTKAAFYNVEWVNSFFFSLFFLLTQRLNVNCSERMTMQHYFKILFIKPVWDQFTWFWKFVEESGTLMVRVTVNHLSPSGSSWWVWGWSKRITFIVQSVSRIVASAPPQIIGHWIPEVRDPCLNPPHDGQWCAAPPPVLGKLALHKTAPWCQKNWGLLGCRAEWLIRGQTILPCGQVENIYLCTYHSNNETPVLSSLFYN